MTRCFRRRNLAGLLIALVIFISIEFWAGNNTPDNQVKYDANYIKLLRDYQSKRIKKSKPVLITSVGNQSKSAVQPKPLLDRRPRDDIAGVSLNNSVLWRDPSETSVNDLFIAVKSSGKFHKTRLPLLLDTWIPLARQSTFLITDVTDPDLVSRFEPGHYKKSTCSQSHYRWGHPLCHSSFSRAYFGNSKNRKGLVCKVSLAYDLFMENTERRWFCIADDDTYINIPNLLTLLQQHDYTADWYIGRPSLKYPIRVNIDNSMQSFWFHTGGAGYCISRGLALKMAPYALGGRLRELADRIKVPDDVAVGYVINNKLGVDATRMLTFHSHLEGLWRISPHDLKNQVTLSYGEFDSGSNHVISNVVNTGKLIPTYPPPFDPTRGQVTIAVKELAVLVIGEDDIK